MTEIALFDAKNRLSELIDRVLSGETIAITRRGKVVAQLAPPDDADAMSSARAAIDRLRESRKGVSLAGLKSRQLIAQGRR